MARFAAAVERGRGGRAAWPTRPWPRLVAAGGLFRDVEPGRFPHVLELPLDAFDGHLRSYASIAALPEERRCALRDGLWRIVEEEPSLRRGGRLTFPFVVEGFRAVASP